MGGKLRSLPGARQLWLQMHWKPADLWQAPGRSTAAFRRSSVCTQIPTQLYWPSRCWHAVVANTAEGTCWLCKLHGQLPCQLFSVAASLLVIMPTLPCCPGCHQQTPTIALGSSWGHLVLMSTQGGSTCTWCHSPGASAAPCLPPSCKSPHKLRMPDGAAMPLVDATVVTLQPASGSRCSCRDTGVLTTATSPCSRSRTLAHPRRRGAPLQHLTAAFSDP